MKTAKLIILILLILITVCISCTNSTKSSSSTFDAYVRDSVLNIDSVLRNSKRQKLLLSDIADSITYITLETTESTLTRTKDFYTIYNEYITNYNNFYKWDGSFFKKYGKRGEGKGFDQGAYRVLPLKNYSYSFGSKIMKHDLNGNFIEEVPLLYIRDQKEEEKIYNLYKLKEAYTIGDYIIIYTSIDSLYWLNEEMKVVHCEQILQMPDNVNMDFDISLNHTRIFSNSYSGILFYNYYNDTIFSISETGIKPEWVISLGSKRLPNEVSFNLLKLYGDVIKYHRDNVQNSELIKLTDDKIIITSVHETKDYLLLNYTILAYFEHRRNDKKVISNQFLLYNKQDKKFIHVEDAGITDDYDGGPNIKPNIAGNNNTLIASIWPFELKEYVDENRNSGKISPKLLKLADSINSDDNPILILLHLK